MFLKKAQLQNFRNYENLELSFTKPYNFLFGANARGKSTFLEALFCLALGKSYCAMNETDIIKWGESAAAVRAQIERNSLTFSVEIHYLKQGNTSLNKTIRINNKNCSRTAELIKNAFFVHFSPQDFNLIKGAANFRRKFLDFLTTQIYPIHFQNLLVYNKCVAQRNFLLKKKTFSAKDMDIWDEQLIKVGSVIIFKRLSALSKFTPIFIKTAEKIFEGEKINLEYTSTTDAAINGTLYDIAAGFKTALNDIRREEILRKATLAGPHRDDFLITLNHYGARQFASFGQQHSLALALKLAQAKLIKSEIKQDPVLLLDDCFVGLDKSRQGKIWDTLKDGTFAQIFITSPISVELDLSGENIAVYEVKDGRISHRDTEAQRV